MTTSTPVYEIQFARGGTGGWRAPLSESLLDTVGSLYSSIGTVSFPILLFFKEAKFELTPFYQRSGPKWSNQG